MTNNLQIRIQGLREKVRQSIYKPLLSFEITAWKTREPLPYLRRTEGERKELKVGESWANEVFDCAWFRFRAPLPPLKKECIWVVRIDINGELCLVDHDGMPVRGLTCVASEYDACLGSPAKVIYRLPEGFFSGEEIELWGDAGLNDLFGRVQNEGKIEFAELAECRDDLRAYYYDLEVLEGLFPGLLISDPLTQKIVEVIDKIERLPLDSESVKISRSKIVPLFQNQSIRPSLKVWAIGHAHLDLAWLWPIRETIRKGARTFANALYNIDLYPNYFFGASQPQLFQWMKEHYEVLYARIKKAVALGRIELQGVFWVEPDCNLTGGESLVRQILLGRRYFLEEFGHVPRFCWQPDVFGYNGQLPQILKKSEIDYFMTQKLSWNVVNRFPYYSFHWEGIDGTRILTHMLPEETYNSPASPDALRKILTTATEGSASTHALMVYGIGDGGAGPDAEHIERLIREKNLADLPEVVFSKSADFFEQWSQDSKNFPSWRGELYLERHQGTFTTQAKVKLNNRQCELRLFELEWLAVMAEVAGLSNYPSKELDEIWKEVLLYQFHDILPGSSIKRVYDECGERQELLLRQIEALSQERASALSGSSQLPMVFNASSWTRSEWIKWEGSWRYSNVPALGVASLLGVKNQTFQELRASDRQLENEYLRAEFNEDGTLAHLYDKVLNWETVASGEKSNEFYLFKDNGDAWDFEIDYKNKDMEVYLRQTPSQAKRLSVASEIDGPCAIIRQTFAIGKSEIHQTICLRSGARQLEFDHKIVWRDERTMLRMFFPVAVVSKEARFEIPFGSILRSTGSASSFERAQIEVPAHQWIDLSDSDRGIALLNDCKYGFRVKNHTMEITVLRSVPHPGKGVGKDNLANEKENAVYTDLGTHFFRCALFPHAAAAIPEITKAARHFNMPLRVVGTQEITMASAVELFPPVIVDQSAIEIVAIKRAEKGEGIIVRLLNGDTNSLLARIDAFQGWKMEGIVNLVESPEKFIGKPLYSYEFQPFELLSIRLVKSI
ncbi:MAG: glycoside hydrolase family 38 C-terminal domain-containing protein [Verrucomicrobiota bacterium]